MPDDVRRIYETCKEILQLANSSGVTTGDAADRIAESRFKPSEDISE